LSTLSNEDRRRMDVMCDAMVSKLLHKPLMELKRSGDQSDETRLIEAVQQLFKLEIDAAAGASREEAVQTNPSLATVKEEPV